MAEPNTSTEFRAASSLPAAMLLATSGGGLDAFIYRNHGHVFAAAMTGNAVLLGLAALSRDGRDVFRHTVPLLAFVCGVWASKMMVSRLRDRAAFVGLLGEIITLTVASFLPESFPNLIFIAGISLVAAWQVASFRTVDSYAYNSTFITGNIRTAIDGLYDAMDVVKRAEGLRKFRELIFIVLAFLAGAVVAGGLAPKLLNHTLWFVELPLVCVLSMVWRRRAG